MATLVERILGRVKQRKFDRLSMAEQRYQQIRVAAAADETDVDDEDVELVLQELGITIEKFAQDVELTRKDRLPSLEVLADAGKHKGTAAAAQAEFDRLNAEYKKVQSDWAKKIRVQFEALQAAEHAESMILYAERRLLDSAHEVYPALVERERELNGQLAGLRQEQETQQDRIAEYQQHIEANAKDSEWYVNALKTASESHSPDLQAKLRGLREALPALRRQISDWQDAIVEIEKKQQAVRDQLAEIHKAKLLP